MDFCGVEWGGVEWSGVGWGGVEWSRGRPPLYLRLVRRLVVVRRVRRRSPLRHGIGLYSALQCR
jgi:hypothetical protein